MIAYTGDFLPATLDLLTNAGFTNLTEIAPGSLEFADLSGFDLLWVSTLTLASTYAGAEANVQSFVDDGGGLVALPMLMLSLPTIAWPEMAATPAVTSIASVSNPAFAGVAKFEWMLKTGLIGNTTRDHRGWRLPSTRGLPCVVSC